MLAAGDQLFHWAEEDRQLRRIVFSGLSRTQVFPTHVHLYNRGLLLTLPDGRVLKGTFKARKTAPTTATKSKV